MEVGHSLARIIILKQDCTTSLKAANTSYGTTSVRRAQRRDVVYNALVRPVIGAAVGAHGLSLTAEGGMNRSIYD